MKRFFGRDDEPEQAETEATTSTGDTEPAPAPEPKSVPSWEVDLTPARRGPGQEERRANRASNAGRVANRPAERRPDPAPEPSLPPGIGGTEARLDILTSITRSFRDAISDRLSGFAGEFEQVTAEMAELRQATATTTSRLEQTVADMAEKLAAATGDLTALSERMRAVMDQLLDYDLRAASQQMEAGLAELREQVAAGKGDLGAALAKDSEVRQRQLDSSISDVADRLAGLEERITRQAQEIRLLRRRLPVNPRAEAEPAAPAPVAPAPKRRLGRK